MKNIFLIILFSFIIIYVFRSVLKSKMVVKESFFWMIGSIVALILAIFPTMLDGLASYLGISYPPTLFFIICILFLLFMIFRDSKRIAEQQEKIYELGQQIAYLKNEIKNKK